MMSIQEFFRRLRATAGDAGAPHFDRGYIGPSLLSTPLLMLEPRMMFDAAGLVTGLEAEQDAHAKTEAEAMVDPYFRGEARLQSAASTPRAVVFVDSSVADRGGLLRGMDDDAELVIIDQGASGLAQIADYLRMRPGVSAVHVLSHGSVGELRVGSDHVTAETLASYKDNLNTIRAALTEGADVLLYGCRIGFGEEGRNFVDSLARWLAADVAASDDLTGGDDSDGNWLLEVRAGDIEAENPFAAEALANYRGRLQEFAIEPGTPPTVDDDGHRVLTPEFIQVTDPGNDPIYFHTSVMYDGHVALASAPDTPIDSFSQEQLADGLVIFVHDTGDSQPVSAGFFVYASDNEAGEEFSSPTRLSFSPDSITGDDAEGNGMDTGDNWFGNVVSVPPFVPSDGSSSESSENADFILPQFISLPTSFPPRSFTPSALPPAYGYGGDGEAPPLLSLPLLSLAPLGPPDFVGSDSYGQLDQGIGWRPIGDNRQSPGFGYTLPSLLLPQTRPAALGDSALPRSQPLDRSTTGDLQPRSPSSPDSLSSGDQPRDALSDQDGEEGLQTLPGAPTDGSPDVGQQPPDEQPPQAEAKENEPPTTDQPGELVPTPDPDPEATRESFYGNPYGFVRQVNDLSGLGQSRIDAMIAALTQHKTPPVGDHPTA